MGHKNDGSVCEVILDRLLTCILWLKNPSIKLSLETIIAAYSHDLFIKRRVWDKFYEVLYQLKQEKKIDSKDISALFYHNYIEDVLKEFDENETHKITPEFVLREIEKAAKFMEEKAKKQIEEKEKEFLRRLEKEISAKEQKKDEEWREKLQQIKDTARKKAEEEAIKRSNKYASILTSIILIIIFVIYIMLRRLGALEWFYLISVLLGGGIWEIWTNLKKHYNTKLSERLYEQKIKEGVDTLLSKIGS